jgi:serine protease Do
MNAKCSPPFFFVVALSVTLLVAGAPTACARDTRTAEKSREQSLPLKFNIDPKPIDRDAPDRLSYAPIIDRTSSSVVFVYSTKQVRAQPAAPFLDDPVLRRFFGIPQGRGSQPPERTQRGLGSGVIVSNDGYILTNSHVVEGADDVKVSIGESVRRYDARVVGTDSLADIAVLKIDAQDLSPATLGDSDMLMVGDSVFAIGNPFGVGLSVSRGIVSALSRGNLGIEQIEDFIQTDAAINMGNSGGALIDSAGRVVGINTAILSRTGGFAGIGFAIPINLVRNVAEQIVNTGKVDRGYLGVYPQALSPELATQFNTQAGALVAEVAPGSAAEKAGLKAGDIITKVNDLEIRDPRQLLLTVSQLAPGTSVSIQYLREGKSRTATATLAQRPEDSLAGSEGERGGAHDDGVLDGVGVTDITPDVRDQMSIPPRIQGAIITQVDPSSASARQGLRPGDVILELDRRPVRNAEEAVRLSEEIKGPRVLVRIWREGRSLFVVVDESSEE